MTTIERDSRKIIKRLTREGWVQVSQAGSHVTFKNPRFAFLVTVPHPRRDLPLGTARNIAMAAGWL